MKINLKPDLSKREKLNHIWSFGGNTCHAPLILRPDMQQQLKMAKKELGFKYVRCHGTISDDMEVVNDKGKYNFKKLNKMIDILLSMGLRPFLEISAMPGFFARNQKHITHYVFRSAPPKDWSLWYDLIKKMMANFKRKYGLKEIEKWYFEVWNEPDLAFWSGSQKEYFKLYDLAAKAIKETSPTLKVCGPATARTVWIPEFLDHITTPSKDYDLDVPRCDLISTHAYPSDLAFLDADVGEVKVQNSNIMKTLFGAAREAIDEKLGPGVPMVIGEWNSSAGPLAFNHDECNNAPYIAKTMDELEQGICQGSLYWNISDIYEECTFHYEPFHGGYGLMNVNNVRKSSFHAFKLMNQLGKERISTKLSKKQLGLGCILTEKGKNYQLLVYYHREPDCKQPQIIKLKLDGFPKTVSQAIVTSVTPGAGSVYETWRELGSPDYPTCDILCKLEKASQPKQKKMNLKTKPLEVELGTLVKVEFKR